jgi:two-component system LytT family response regulator
MVKYKTIIVDDMPVNIAEAKRITEQDDRFEIVATANNGEEGLKEIIAHRPDLVLLDIEMPIMGGFDLVIALKQFPTTNPTIIFVTVYDEFAIQAIRHSAFDYILKTNLEEYLPQALNKFVLERANKNMNLGKHIESLMSSLANNKQIVIQSNVSDVFVRPAEIVYISTRKNGSSYIYLENGDRLTTSQKLTSIEIMLPGKDFYRLCRKNLINVRQIIEIKKEKGIVGRRFIRMKNMPDAEKLLIPIRKYKLLLEFINANRLQY